MANTISTYCKEYVNNSLEKLRMFNTYSLAMDLVKNYISHTGKVVSYDSITIASGMGTFDRDTGYTKKDITATRVDKTLSKDYGNSLVLDAMDRDEAQIEDGIVGLYNRYWIKNVIPTFDTTVYTNVASDTSVPEAVVATVSTTNILSSLLADKKTIENKRVKWEECIIYISVSAKSILDEVSLGKGYLQLGNWNGNMDATVEMFKSAKLVVVPDATLGSNINWLIVHPLAVSAFVVYQDAEFFEKVPGYGTRRKQVDVGLYFDAWVEPNGYDGTLVNVKVTRA